MKRDRIFKVKEFIMSRSSVSMRDLSVAFPVSINTLRRDLHILQEQGLIYKIYGGVVYNRGAGAAPPPGGDAPETSGKKRAIGALAAGLIENEDIVFIDSGTTTPWIVDHIGSQKSFTIVTANLQVLIRAAKYDNVRLMALPGAYMPSSDSFSGAETVEALGRYNITKAFLAAWGYSLEHGATVVSPWEYEKKKLVVSKAKARFLLIDAGKFDLVTMLTYCPPAAINAVITDERPSEKFITYFNQNNIRVFLPSE